MFDLVLDAMVAFAICLFSHFPELIFQSRFAKTTQSLKLIDSHFWFPLSRSQLSRPFVYIVSLLRFLCVYVFLFLSIFCVICLSFPRNGTLKQNSILLINVILFFFFEIQDDISGNSRVFEICT